MLMTRGASNQIKMMFIMIIDHVCSCSMIGNITIRKLCILVFYGRFISKDKIFRIILMPNLHIHDKGMHPIKSK
jgi:hypothetical protein